MEIRQKKDLPLTIYKKKTKKLLKVESVLDVQY